MRQKEVGFPTAAQEAGRTVSAARPTIILAPTFEKHDDAIEEEGCVG